MRGVSTKYLKKLRNDVQKGSEHLFGNNAGMNFIHNHPPAHPRGFAPNICPHPGAFCPGVGDLLG